MKKNTEFGPEIKRVTLHPLKDDGTIDTGVNLYPKTLINGVVDRDGKQVDIQEKLIAGDNITIEGNVISSTGGGSGTEYVIDITEPDQLEHPISQEQGEEIFETQPDCIHLIYNVNVDTEDLTIHLNGDAYLVKQINLRQEISDLDETKDYENAIVYTLLSDDTLNAIKINKSQEGEITVNDMAEWNFADIVDSIAGKANNSEVVHLNGDETIDGHKTFTGGFNVSTYNGFGLENDGHGISASDALYLYGYKEINDTTAFYDPVIIEKTSKFITSDTNKYGLVLPDVSGYDKDKTIATEEYTDERLIAKQDVPTFSFEEEKLNFIIPNPIFSEQDLYTTLENLEAELASIMIMRADESPNKTVQYIDNFGEVWSFKSTVEELELESANIVLVVGDKKYTTSIIIETDTDTETGGARVVVDEVSATTLADDAATIHSTGDEVILGNKTFKSNIYIGDSTYPVTSHVFFGASGQHGTRIEIIQGKKYENSRLHIYQSLGDSILIDNSTCVGVFDNLTDLGSPGQNWKDLYAKKLKNVPNGFTSNTNKGIIIPETNTWTEDKTIATEEYINNSLSTKQDTLTAGTNISINNNVISYSLPRYTGDTFNVHDDSVEWHMQNAEAARLVSERPASIELFFDTSDPATYVMTKAADIEDSAGAAYTVSLGAQTLTLIITEVQQEEGSNPTYNFEGNITEFITADTINGTLIYDYDGTAETDERIYNKQPATVRVMIPDTSLEVFLHKTDISGTEHYYSGSTFIEQLGGWITYNIKFDFDGVDYTDEVSYYHSYSEIDLTDSEGIIEKVYNERPMILHMLNGELDVFLQKTDFQEGVLYYRTIINAPGVGDVIMIVNFAQDAETGELNYNIDYIPIGGQPAAESDLTIMTDPADMANIIRAYNQQSLSDFKENHKYGLSVDENRFRTLFTTELSGEDVKDLMWGYYNRQGRLITVNGERLKFDRPASDTYRLHNSDNSIEITVVSGEESDTVTVNISEEFAYLEIIFFHYEGE